MDMDTMGMKDYFFSSRRAFSYYMCDGKAGNGEKKKWAVLVSTNRHGIYILFPTSYAMFR